MIIHLNEIPTEGKSWQFDQSHQKLHAALQDLLGNSSFSVELNIVPLAQAGAYELKGSVQTQLPEDCSRCGLDFQFSVKQKFSNLLMPALHVDRDAHFAKPNHYSDLHEEGPDVVEYRGNEFDAGEFLHEFIALAEPLIPAPEEDCDGKCSVCKIDLKNHTFSYNEELDAPNNPFERLKGLKLN